MTTVLVFDIETIPDVVGLRRLEDFPASMTDSDVAQQVMQLRLEKTGSDFLPLYLQRIVAISCVIRRTTKEGLPQIKVGSLGNPDDSEKVLIQAFFDLIEKYTPQLVSWNGSGFDLPVLHYRALINQVHAPRYWEMGESQDSDSREFKWNNYISRYHMRHLDLMDLARQIQWQGQCPFGCLSQTVRLSRQARHGWQSSLASLSRRQDCRHTALLRNRCREHLSHVLPLPTPAGRGDASRAR
jgi:3'-5' exonuclease